jgi:hypothetical protein
MNTPNPYTTTTGAEDPEVCALCRSRIRRERAKVERQIRREITRSYFRSDAEPSQSRGDRASGFAIIVAIVSFASAGAWAIASLIAAAIGIAEGRG